MANTKLSDLSRVFGSGYSTSDVMLLLDVADTSMASSGTDKGILVSTFLSQYIHAGSNVTLTSDSNGVTVASSGGGTGASVANTYIVKTTASDCANSQALASLATGLLKVTTTTGVLSTAAASDLPSTGLKITQWTSDLGTGSISGGTATFNLATYNRWTLTLDHTQTVTLALSGVTVGQQFTLLLSQDSTGSCLVTWFSGIKWAGGSEPTLTTTASKGDAFTFICVGTGSYWGMIAGQNF